MNNQLKRITLGHQGSQDCCLRLDNKEYLIESLGWNMLSFVRAGILNFKNERDLKIFLDYVYENFPVDDGENIIGD